MGSAGGSVREATAATAAQTREWGWAPNNEFRWQRGHRSNVEDAPVHLACFYDSDCHMDMISFVRGGICLTPVDSDPIPRGISGH